MKKTKVKSSKLNSLLMVLLLTAVLLIMSTYAWFTANRTVNIDKIDVTVATSSGLQISANGIDWKTVLEKDDILNAHTTYETAVNQLPTLMAPTSTALELDENGHLKMFFGKVEADMDTGSDTYGNFLLTTQLQQDKPSEEVGEGAGEYDKGYYMAFDVFFKVESGADDLYMSGKVTEPELTAKGLANAARVALIKGASTASGSEVATIQGLSTAGGEVSMWEPNADAHTIHGVENAAALKWATISTGENNATVPYDGVKGEISSVVLADAVASKHSNEFASITPTWATKKAEVPNLKMPSGLNAGITKYRLYLWVEGQDVDCENNASGTDVEYSLTFSLDEIVTNATPDGEP